MSRYLSLLEFACRAVALSLTRLLRFLVAVNHFYRSQFPLRNKYTGTTRGERRVAERKASNFASPSRKLLSIIKERQRETEAEREREPV